MSSTSGAPIAPLIMAFGQPWHAVTERLPAPLVAEVDAWLASKERGRVLPNRLAQKLYKAYLKAKIEIFPR